VPTPQPPPDRIACARCGATAAPKARFCAECGAALPAPGSAPADPLLAHLARATAGEYDLAGELGRGGMAVVYLAWDRELARQVAIKVLRPELTGDPTMSQRFLQEARTAANLDAHPNVVRVYRATEARGLRYFVMRYVDGCSLEQLLRATGPLPPDLAAHVVNEVALALQYAHERGVVHRDVKPANILLDREGGVAVTDFGIAKVADADHLTGTGFGFGTPHYMSPEQWRSEPMTPASDQYALGVVAYQTVAGQVPFDGTHYEVQERHLRASPPALGAVRPGVPAALRAVVEVMLAKHPIDRFRDLHGVSAALGQIPRDPPARLRERLARLIPAALAAETDGPGRSTIPHATAPEPDRAAAGVAARTVPLVDPAARAAGPAVAGADVSDPDRPAVPDVGAGGEPAGPPLGTVVTVDAEPPREPLPERLPEFLPESLPESAGRRHAGARGRGGLVARARPAGRAPAARPAADDAYAGARVWAAPWASRRCLPRGRALTGAGPRAPHPAPPRRTASSRLPPPCRRPSRRRTRARAPRPHAPRRPGGARRRACG
jgi:hypothetical protein